MQACMAKRSLWKKNAPLVENFFSCCKAASEKDVFHKKILNLMPLEKSHISVLFDFLENQIETACIFHSFPRLFPRAKLKHWKNKARSDRAFQTFQSFHRPYCFFCFYLYYIFILNY